jgi:hypothetical protein
MDFWNPTSENPIIFYTQQESPNIEICIKKWRMSMRIWFMIGHIGMRMRRKCMQEVSPAIANKKDTSCSS